MKIGILQCDRVREALREQGFNDYPDMFMERLRAVDPDLDFAVYRCLDGEFPPDPAACDAYLCTGSRFSVLDPDEWIRELERFVVTLVEARIPYIGICFGHQVLAKALGGTVERAAVGWGVGVSENVIDEPQPWMEDDVLRDVNLVVSHQDQVTRVPDGMAVLGGSDFCPNYFCAVGSHALSIQGHPEFSLAFTRALMDIRRGIIDDAVLDKGVESLQRRVDDDAVFRWMVNFYRQALASREPEPVRATPR